MALKIYQDNDSLRQVFVMLGFIDEESGTQKKQVFKHTAVNEVKTNEIDHHKSDHAMGLQRSQYLCIDDTI